MPLIITKNHSKEFSRIRKKYNEFFQQNTMFTFTNIMYQYIVNLVKNDRVIVFHPVDGDNCFHLAAVPKGEDGYEDHCVPFLSDLTYIECCDVCDQLNKELFGIDTTEGDIIVGESMAKAMQKN